MRAKFLEFHGLLVHSNSVTLGGLQKQVFNVLPFLRVFLERNLGGLTCAFATNPNMTCMCLGRRAYTRVMETTQEINQMNTQEIINEATKLGNAKVGTSEVQARALELEEATGLIFSGSSPERDGNSDTHANLFWNTYHKVLNEAFRVSGSRSHKLTPEQVARAKEIIKAQQEEILVHLKAKYQGRNELFGMKPVGTSTLRQWAKSGDMRNHYYLRQALRQAGEL